MENSNSTEKAPKKKRWEYVVVRVKCVDCVIFIIHSDHSIYAADMQVQNMPKWLHSAHHISKSWISHESMWSIIIGPYYQSIHYYSHWLSDTIKWYKWQGLANIWWVPPISTYFKVIVIHVDKLDQLKNSWEAQRDLG